MHHCSQLPHCAQLAEARRVPRKWLFLLDLSVRTKTYYQASRRRRKMVLKYLKKLRCTVLRICYTFPMRILLASLLLVLVIPAYGSIIIGAGVTDISAPPSIQPGQLLSDSTMYVFSEQTDL